MVARDEWLVGATPHFYATDMVVAPRAPTNVITLPSDEAVSGARISRVQC